MFTLPNPQTIADARLQASVAKRAATLLTTQGYTILPYAGMPDVFLIFPPDCPSWTHYVVDLSEGASFCTCEFYKHHCYCKHLLALDLHLDELRALDEQAKAEAKRLADAETSFGVDYSDGPVRVGGCLW